MSAVGQPVAPIARGFRLRSWVLWTTVAEVVGFLVPATVGVLTVDAGPRLALPLLLVAGAVEGFILGAAQARVLAAALPRLPRLRWAAATSGSSPSARWVASSWPASSPW